MICGHINIAFGRSGFMSQLSMRGYVQIGGYVDRLFFALRSVQYSLGHNSDVLQVSGPHHCLLLVDEPMITVVDPRRPLINGRTGCCLAEGLIMLTV